MTHSWGECALGRGMEWAHMGIGGNCRGTRLWDSTKVRQTNEDLMGIILGS